MHSSSLRGTDFKITQDDEAITGRGVNVLMVPDNDADAREVTISPVERESARRNVQRYVASNIS